jgi:DNA (cytosine-5)-methyltransferase 1
MNWTVGAAERLRWSLVGNAVSVPVAAWLGKRLLEPGFYFGDLDEPWTRKSGGFPRAARFDGNKRYVVNVGAFPTWEKRKPLHKFLKYAGTPLSKRATSGFLSRAEASSLRFVPGFLEAVRAHLDLMQGKSPAMVQRLSSSAKSKSRKTKQPLLIAAE